MSAPLITAVICTRNRAGFAEKCLKSLLRQSLDPSLYEIIIVDNGSTDNTREVLASYTDSTRIRYIAEPVVGLSRARNTGWKNSRGLYVGYIDDDATAGNKWLEAALKCFEKILPTPVWIGGPIELEWEVPRPEWINGPLSVPLGKVDWGKEEKWLEPNQRLGGGNSFFFRKCLEELNGFDENLGRKRDNLLSGEEDHLRRRLEDAGKRLYYHPDVCIRHFVPAERIKPTWFYRRFYWGGISDYLMKKSLGSNQGSTALSSPSQDGRMRQSKGERLAKNFLKVSGLFSSPNDTILSRASFAYHIGKVMAATGLYNIH